MLWVSSSSQVIHISIYNIPDRLKKPGYFPMKVVPADITFITLGARRVTNTPTFRSGMK